MNQQGSSSGLILLSSRAFGWRIPDMNQNLRSWDMLDSLVYVKYIRMETGFMKCW